MSPLSQDRVLRYLESRIKDLERRMKELSEELEILKEIAKELSKARQAEVPAAPDEARQAQQEKVRVIYAEGEIVASEVASDDTVKVVLRSGLKASDDVVTNFLLRVLEELKERRDLTDYRVRESGGYIVQIDLVNPSPLALRQVEIALKYVWSKITAAG